MRYIYIILAIILFYSCEKEVEVDLDDPDKVLAVDGRVTDLDTIQWVKLSYIQNYNSTDLPDFTEENNAIVKLFEDNDEVGTLVFNDSTERFEIQFKGTVGKSYNINIVTEDGEEYLSEPEMINYVGPIDSLWSVMEIDPFTDKPNYYVRMNTFETPGIGDNYQWKTYINGEYQDEPGDITAADDAFVDGQPILGIDIYILSEEEFAELQSESPDGRVFVRVEQTAVTRKYFEFLNEVVIQTVFVGGPFDPPPAEIRGNVYKASDINDRALGYFQGISVKSAITEVVP